MQVNADDQDDFWIFEPIDAMAHQWFANCGANSLTLTQDGCFAIDQSETDEIIDSFEAIGGIVNFRL